MSKEQALDLLGQYCNWLWGLGDRVDDPVLLDAREMYARFPKDGSEARAMRWLGYMQGVLVATREFTLEEVKEHTRRGIMLLPKVEGL